MNTIRILLSLICLVLVSCNSNSNAEKVEELEGPLQWINYPGKESILKAKNVVLISGDEEYRSEESLPQLAKILAEHHGFNCTVLFAQDPEKPGVIDPNYLKNIPGLEALQQADLMILFTRFRELPDEQMKYINDYLMAGKPLLAIRTATHAFEFKDSTSQWKHYSNSFTDENSPWDGGFGRLVLGEKWYKHHGHHKHQSTLGLIAAGAEQHPVVNGLTDTKIWGPTDVYGVRLPLPGDAMPIILGQVMNGAEEFDEADPFFGLKPSDSVVATNNPGSKEIYNPNDPMMPIAWTKSYQLPQGQSGKSFTSTIGSSTDFANEGVRRLLVNATYFLMELEVPEKADVSLIGNYQPTAYSFHDDQYWDDKNLLVKDYASNAQE